MAVKDFYVKSGLQVSSNVVVGAYTSPTFVPQLNSIVTSGNIGVGTSLPDSKLDVVGGNIHVHTNSAGIVFPDGTFQSTRGTNIPEVAAATGDIQGIVTRTDSQIAFNESTREFSITPTGTSWDFYYKGNLHTISSPLTITINNTSGGRFIRIDPNSLTLVEGGPIPDFVNDVILSYIYWNADTGKAIIVGDERHGSKRDTTWHSNQHLNVGTVWRSGGALTYTLNDDTAVTLGVGTPINIADEDLLHVITNSASPSSDYQQPLYPTASLEVLYLSGNYYTPTAQSTDYWVPGTSLASYNLISGGSGSLTDAGEGKFITYWVLATNDIRRPIKLVMGRVAHDTIDDAIAEEFEEYGLSFAEQVFMHQIVLKTSASYTNNSAKVVISNVRKIISKVATSASSVSAADHNNLTGRDSVDSHPIYAITGLQSSLDSKQNVLVSGTNIKTINSSSILGSGDITLATTNTTYSISAETDLSGAAIRLTGSDSFTDNVVIAAGANISIVRTDANTITIGTTPGVVSNPGGTNRSIQFNNAGSFGGDVNKFSFDTNGNVGIGTSSPLALLDVRDDALINGITVGLGSGAVATNTAVGYQALKSNTTGPYNTAIGYQALFTSTDGYKSTAIGYQASYNQLGNYASPSHAIGYQALYSNTTGYYVQANGYQALYSNTTGRYNHADGYQALYSNTGGHWNQADGYKSLYSNTDGVKNLAFGFKSMYLNTTGLANQAFGWEALYWNSTGYGNQAFGYLALTNNTTGNYNQADGYLALMLNTTGYNNQADGYCALNQNEFGFNNLATGYKALYYNKGNVNAAFGYQAGLSVTSGNKNTLIGSYTGSAGPVSQTGSNYIVLSDGDGNVRWYSDPTGNIGIGTTSAIVPNKLSVYNGNIQVGSTGKGIVFPDGTLQTTAAANTPPGGTDRAVQFNNSGTFGGDVTKFAFDTNGNIGIGTSAPLALLDVRGGISGQSTTVTSLQASGVATVNSLTSNGAISGTTYSGIGQIFTTSNFNAGGAAIVNSLTSNTSISAASLSVSGDTTITGNLFITGNVNTLNSNVLVVDDPIIYLGDNNPANTWDLGLVSSYTSGTYKHTGLVRNQSDGVWTIFDNLTSEPTQTIDWAQVGLNYGSFKTGNINVAATTSSSSYLTGALITAGGAGIAGALNVGGSIYSAGVINASSSAIVNSLTSNGTISGTTITGSTGFEGGYVSGTVFNARTSLIASSITSNGTISGTTITGSTGFEGGYVSGTIFNARTSAIVGSLTSNGTISGTTITGSIGFEGGSVSGTVFNARISLIAASITSNGEISGTTITGSIGFEGGYVSGTVFNARTSLIAASVTSNGEISGTTYSGTGQIFTTSNFNAGGAAIVNSLTSNGTVSGTTGLFTDNIGIGTSSSSYQKVVVWNGNIAVQTSGFGYVFPDGTFQTTAAANTPPGGTNRAVQFNDSGAFGGDVAKFAFDTNGNIGIGTSAPLALLDVRGDALIHGLTIGLGNSSVAYNTVFGYQALNSNLNTPSIIPTAGKYHTAIGYRALYSNTDGYVNHAVGYQALYSNTIGGVNHAAGYQALYSNIDGSSNHANGYQALYSNIDGIKNHADGYGTLYSNTNGFGNQAHGLKALYYNTTGILNLGIGYYTMWTNTTGSKNQAVGVNALISNTTGDNNQADGYQSLFYNTTGSNNQADGYKTLRSNTTGNLNLAVGYKAGFSITTGNKNTLLGAYQGLSGPVSQTGNNYVVISDGDGNVRFYSDPNGNIGIGTTSASVSARLDVYGGNIRVGTVGYGVVFPDGTLQTTAPVGTSAGGTDRAVQFNNAGGFGGDVAKFAFDTNGNVGIGTSAPLALLDVSGDALVNGLTIGKGNGFVATNTVIGYQALRLNTTGYENTVVGYQALFNGADGYRNIAIGYQSQWLNSGYYGSPNHAVGYKSLYSNTTGYFNQADGYQALYSNTTGRYNLATGYQALYSNTTGNWNHADGYMALKANTVGNENLAIGYKTMVYNIDGSMNLAIGWEALKYNDNANRNTAIGFKALISNTSGEFNTGLGYQTLYAANGNVNAAFGYQAGYGITSGNKNTVIGSYEGSAGPISGSGSNYVVLSDGDGNVRFYSDPTGNIGIGTTSATVSARLGVWGGNIKVGSTGFGLIFPDGTLQTTAAANTPPGGTNRAVQFNDASAFGGDVTKFAFDINGNVGIGTSAPLALLDVRSDALINGVTVGLGKGSVAGNTVFGYQAFKSNTVPYGGSTAFGYQTLYSTTSGSGIAVGYQTLRLNTTGWDNLAIGDWALENNTTGTYNQAIGHQALRNNTTGTSNLAFGRFALYVNSDGYMNHAVGMYSMYGNTSGHHNTADGYEALYYNNTGSYNSACGYHALYQSKGNKNTAFGYNAGANITTGNKNTLVGTYKGDIGPISNTGNNYVVLSDGDGNVRFYSDPNGNIGIGTTSATVTSRLGVYGGNIQVGSTGFGIVFPDGSFQTSADMTIPGGTTGAIQYKTSTGGFGGDTSKFTLDNNGNVGIATTSPVYKLQVNGSFAATTKSFVIDHPSIEGMKLRYGSLESPYHGVRLTGEGEVQNGMVTVKLPNYISNLCKAEGAQVQLTNIRHGKTLWIEDLDIDNNQFTVACDSDYLDNKTYKFYWSFTGIRKDIDDLLVEYYETI